MARKKKISATTKRLKNQYQYNSKNFNDDIKSKRCKKHQAFKEHEKRKAKFNEVSVARSRHNYVTGPMKTTLNAAIVKL